MVWSLKHLGKTYSKKGDYPKAQKVLIQALKIFERKYGSNHVETATIQKNLGEVYMTSNNLEQAKEYMLKALKTFQLYYQADKFKLLRKDRQIGFCNCLETLGDIDFQLYYKFLQSKTPQKLEYLRTQAIHYLTQALEILKKFFPDNSLHRLRIEGKLKSLKANAAINKVDHSISEPSF